MRTSAPIAVRTQFTSAPTFSHRLAISLINDMRVASMAFAAYLVISAEGKSMNMTLKLLRRKGRYRRSMSLRPRSLSMPMTTRSGLIKSLMAAPSLRNSGFEASSNSVSGASSSRELCLISALTRAEVPTGTVDLVTKSV